MPLPTVDCLGIGAQKAGTTWLFRCLFRHPDMYLPMNKDLQYIRPSSGTGEALIWATAFHTASRPGIAALAERFGGHACGWLARCDAILAGGNPDV